MAYPAGITLRTVNVGGATALESGEPLTITVRFAASRPLIWGATGWRFPSVAYEVAGTVGNEISVDLPVTDQAGWRTNSNQVIDVSAAGSYTHTYTATVTTMANGRVVSQDVIGPFALPGGDLSPVDLDVMLPVGTVAGGVVSVPDAWTAQIEAASDGIPAAVADYLTANPPSGSPDATTLTKGIVRLAGDLGGTAALPTVPGLASKVEDTDPRLSDARTPTAHGHAVADVTGLQAALDAKAPALGPDDNYVTDAEKAALHTHPAVIAQGATAADARAAIGAGTSSFSGDYADLTGKPAIPDTEAIQDVVGAMVAAAGGTYDDAGGSITLPASGGGGAPSVDWMPPSGAWLNQQVDNPGPQIYTDPNRWTITPIVLPDGMPSVDRLAVSATATQPFAVALYELSATRGQLTLIRDLGVITPAAAGIVVEITLSPSLTLPRLVYVAVKRGTAATANAQLISAMNHADIWVGGLAVAASSNTAAYRSPWLGTDAAPATITVVDTAGVGFKPPATSWRIA